MKYIYHLLLLCCYGSLFAQEGKVYEEKPLFSSHDLLVLTLSFDKEALLSDRGEEPSYHEAILSYTDAEGKVIKLEAKVRARGNTRREAYTCNFPPLRINFPKKKVQNTLFHGQNKLKMVTHCQKESYILKEYLVYRTYNLLTSYSFQVRLSRITYVDNKGTYPDETKYSFFIEDEHELAARNGGEIVKEEIRVKPQEAEPEPMRINYVFQYMTGNKDYEVSFHRNTKIITAADAEAPIAVPYDFDRASVVDVAYAKASWQNKKISNRVFRHLCPSESEIKGTFAHFNSKKIAILELIDNFNYLTLEGRKEMNKYFKEFFKLIAKKKTLTTDFLSNCK